MVTFVWGEGAGDDGVLGERKGYINLLTMNIPDEGYFRIM
jgi:hypothetical protein